MLPSSRFDSLIQYWSARVELPWELVKRQVMAESSGNPRAVSACGAKGLLQLMDATAKEMKLGEPFNPDENLRAGTEYLARQKAAVQLLLHGHTVDPDDIMRFALASYNCGLAYPKQAIKTILAREEPVTWPAVLSELPKSVVRGRTADLKQVRDYVNRILPPPQV